jgi:hypothetical protein
MAFNAHATNSLRYQKPNQGTTKKGNLHAPEALEQLENFAHLVVGFSTCVAAMAVIGLVFN